MYCAKALQLACRCLPQRLKPQTRGALLCFVFSFPAYLYFLNIFICSVTESRFFVGPKTSVFWVFWPYFFVVSFAIL